MRNVRYALLLLSSAVIVLMGATAVYLFWQPSGVTPGVEVDPTETAVPTLANATQPTPSSLAMATAAPPTAPEAPPTATLPATAVPTATPPATAAPIAEPTAPAPTPPTAPTTAASGSADVDTTAVPDSNSNVTVIGRSREGRPIESYRFGTGPQEIIFVGGIHGGYEWNTIVLAYEAIDYFTANPTAVPTSISLYIIPSANPDGQHRVTNQEGRFSAEDVVTNNTFPGRFNAAGVDLNRNWACFWSEEAYWRDQRINPGTGPFSEPETQALRDYFLEILPLAVVFWHSAANGTFAAACPELFEPSLVLAELYGIDAGYPVYEAFTAYEISGDAGDWLSTIGIPSITVELTDRINTEWEKNLRGMQAVLRFYDTGPVEN